VRARCTIGCTRVDGPGLAVTEETLFDLASLTKPLCTVLVTLALIGQGRLRLEDTLVRVFPGPLPAEKKLLCLWQLLNHSSGMLQYRPYFRDMERKPGHRSTAQLLEQLLDEPLVYPPGSESRYSDLGFILLGHVLEHCTGQPLSVSFGDQITKRLGLTRDLFFLPLDQPRPVERQLVAATEDCPWRGRVLQGEVHDEHAWLMGGVAGHAGLFGTLHGVLSLCEWLLDLWQGRVEHPHLPTSLIRTGLTRQLANSTWALGLDTPTVGASSSGSLFSARSVGHLGFTGTSFWIDPEREVVAVLLTNRVHPSRENMRIRSFRPQFHDRVMQCLLGGVGKTGDRE
jgi:CubicO group peptidase (beta-lactamase class C family)